MTTTESLAEREYRRVDPPAAPMPDRRPRSSRRRWWSIGVVILLAWSLWRAGVGPASLNTRGWPLVQRFAADALRPEMSSGFVDVVISASATTIGYAFAGTALALVIGVVGGVLTSETWWERDSQHPRHRRRPIRRSMWLIRGLAALPRGIHEAVWALFLLQVLGRDPLVAVLAIGIPFGAITAKVVAELIDDTAAAPFKALRAAGAGRLAALGYSLGPVVLPDVLSYGFYRLECSLRSSVVLGMIGAGGIGFQLSVSFQSLRYTEVWTLVYALIAMSAVVDWWSSAVRGRTSPRRMRVSAAIAVALTALSAWRLGLRPSTLTTERTRALAGDLIADVWPPQLPDGGWLTLWSASLDTLVLSVIAIAIATACAWPVAFLAARDPSARPTGRLAAALARSILLCTRSIPPPVWALLILFVVFPGPLPGGLALGIYTFGILGRLDAEVVENADPGPTRALQALGARRGAALLYGTAPTVAPRFAALSLYRWEVTMRETVIVGLVGAGGLGRLLAQQNAAIDRAAMVTTVGAIIVLSFVVDVISARIRADLR